MPTSASWSWGALGPSAVDIDEVIRATRLPARKVHIVLLELDLARRLQRHGQQLVSLTGTGMGNSLCCYRNLIPLVRALFVVGLLKSHVEQINQERHLRPVG